MVATRASLTDTNEALALRAQKGDARARTQLIKQNTAFVHDYAFRMRQLCRTTMQEDLLNEGLIGLNKAIDKYDPSVGAKFLTMAVWWIRAEMKRCIQNTDDDIRVPVHVNQKIRSGLIRRQWDEFEALGLSIEEIRQKFTAMYRWKPRTMMAVELALVSTVRLDEPLTDDEGSSSRLDLTPSEEPRQDDLVQRKGELEELRRAVDLVRDQLSGIDLAILDDRLLADVPASLQDIADRVGLSRERIRQKERAVIVRMREAIAHLRQRRESRAKEPEAPAEPPKQEAQPERQAPVACGEGSGEPCAYPVVWKSPEGKPMCATHALLASRSKPTRLARKVAAEGARTGQVICMACRGRGHSSDACPRRRPASANLSFAFSDVFPNERAPPAEGREVKYWRERCLVAEADVRRLLEPKARGRGG